MMIARSVLAALLIAAAASTASAKPGDKPVSPAAQKAFDEMKKMMGVVPGFAKAVPEEVVADAWEELVAIEFSEGALPSKIKSLISLAVASQIPCRYCVYADTEFAKLGGTSERELREAVYMAANTRHWSTFLNGIGTDEAAFRKEVDMMLSNARRMKAPPASMPVTDAASALKDIQGTFGMVPSFMKAFPAAGLAPAWRDMKGLAMNPNTAIPAKYKQLIALGVAAQIPCRYCVYFHTQAARMMGATDAEIREAVAEASLTREWSTIINGSNPDEAQFKREIQTAVRYMKKQMAAAAKAAPKAAPAPAK